MQGSQQLQAPQSDTSRTISRFSIIITPVGLWLLTLVAADTFPITTITSFTTHIIVVTLHNIITTIVAAAIQSPSSLILPLGQPTTATLPCLLLQISPQPKIEQLSN